MKALPSTRVERKLVSSSVPEEEDLPFVKWFKSYSFLAAEVGGLEVGDKKMVSSLSVSPKKCKVSPSLIFSNSLSAVLESLCAFLHFPNSQVCGIGGLFRWAFSI